MKKEQGITIIALVITIIVLLILAGISIGTITGDNGIIKEANNAKASTEKSNWEEQIDSAIISAEAKNRNTKLNDVIQELISKGVINSENDVNKENGAITTKEPSYVIEGKLDEYLVKTLESITGNETTNTIVKDSLGNIVKVPAGFKIVNPTEIVPDGIIIEDVSHEKTKGSQFVWIPVGTVKKADGSTETITLSRYTFDNNGNEMLQEDKVIETYYQELETSDKGNTTAKNIEEFKTKASNGYYIGRYEARDKDVTTARTDSTNDTNQLVCTADNYVYNYVTQPQAANLSRNMYSDSNFESDLMNSYSWDTAITFLQKFDNRADKAKPYSQQNSLNTSLAEQGTNKLSVSDKICNIYDMASNTYEWITETGSYDTYFCVVRGGNCYYSNLSTSSRYDGSHDWWNSGYNAIAFSSFRPLLYL